MSGTRVKDKIRKQKMFLPPQLLRNYKGFRSSVSGWRPSVYFLVCHSPSSGLRPRPCYKMIVFPRAFSLGVVLVELIEQQYHHRYAGYLEKPLWATEDFKMQLICLIMPLHASFYFCAVRLFFPLSLVYCCLYLMINLFRTIQHKKIS